MKPQPSDALEDAPPIAATGQSSSSVKDALDEYARTMRLSPEALLEEIRDLSDQPDLGGPECLTPLEVAEVCTSHELPPSRKEHLVNCEDCRALLAASMPSSAHLEEFLAALEQLDAR